MSEVAFERYRLQSLTGQVGMVKMSPTAPYTSIEQPLARGMAGSGKDLPRLQEFCKSRGAAWL